MSTTKYNPFNPAGRYFIETYLYDHKKTILAFVIAFIFILFGMSIFVWNQGHKSTIVQPPLLPPPKYGYGPFGYGIYAPPKALLDNPPNM